MADNEAIRAFREALLVALEGLQTPWNQRHAYRKRGTQPPLGVWADTLKTWIKPNGRFPGRSSVELLLKSGRFDEAVGGNLLRLYDMAVKARIDERRAKRTKEVVAPAPLPTGHIFIGRRKELDAITGLLTEDAGECRVVVIHAIGGMGKTALARELANRLVRGQSFAATVRVEAATERFDGGHIYQIARKTLSFDDITHQIIADLKLEIPANLPRAERVASLTRYLQQNRLILILDNFDSVPEKLEIILPLVELLGTSGRILITSRTTFDAPHQFQYALGPLLMEDAPEFFRAWARALLVQSVAAAKDDVLFDLWEKTGGLPLAMRLVVGQLSNRPLDVVLTYLSQAKSKLVTGDEHPNAALYRYIFARSWQQINEDSRQLLIRIALQPGGVQQRDLAKMADVSLDLLVAAMMPLLQTSLVDLRGVLGNERYTCHAMTRNFVMGPMKDDLK